MVVPSHVGPSSSAAAAALSRPHGAATGISAPTQTRSKTGTTSHPANMASSIPLSARRAEPLDMSTVERRISPFPILKEPASRTHISSIPEAPTYQPSEEEWANPMEYIRKISPEGRKYGIVKVAPPRSWNPTFAIDSEVCPFVKSLYWRSTNTTRSNFVHSASIFEQGSRS